MVPKKRSRQETTPKKATKQRQLLEKHTPGWSTEDESQPEEGQYNRKPEPFLTPSPIQEWHALRLTLPWEEVYPSLSLSPSLSVWLCDCVYVYFLQEETLCHIHLFSFSLSRESNHFLGRILFVFRTSSAIMKKTSSSVSQELKKNYSKEGITLDKKRGILLSRWWKSIKIYCNWKRKMQRYSLSGWTMKRSSLCRSLWACFVFSLLKSPTSHPILGSLHPNLTQDHLQMAKRKEFLSPSIFYYKKPINIVEENMRNLYGKRGAVT